VTLLISYVMLRGDAYHTLLTMRSMRGSFSSRSTSSVLPNPAQALPVRGATSALTTRRWKSKP
jgi:hypothetical protein